MQAWLRKNILDPIDTVVHPELGALCQNASERVSDVALKYRDKINALEPTHYICSTGLAIAHVNAVCIYKFKLELQTEGRTDARIEQFHSMEQSLFELIGLSTSETQRKLWQDNVLRRAKKSLYSMTIEYKQKRKRWRTNQTQKRGKLKSSHTY
eukprot:1621880-Prymnesium_polylepis.1